MRTFLWISVLSWAVALGAKLFDLIVVAGAWSAAPPASLALLPYGPRFPVNPGDFFLPLSILILIGVVGALITGWKAPLRLRVWVWLPAVIFVIIWAATPAIFWPMNHDLYYGSIGKVVITDAELAQLARRWVAYDWVRVGLIAVGFISSIRAISIPANSKKLESPIN
jgi:hypothetical protein